jgi:hypothetical protein
VTGGWGKLHDEELRYLYSSPSIIRIIRSRKIGRAGQVAQKGKSRNAYTRSLLEARGKETTRETKK